jgi:lycopene cyclase domain-containing protein
MERYTYALLLVASISIPLLRSFETKVAYYRKWKALAAGIVVMMAIFIPWDIIFTRNQIWHFNHQYVTGIFLWSLPLEEWLFFVVIPFCCVFIYEVILYFLPKFYPKASLLITIVLAVVAIAIAILFYEHIYTLVVMSLNAVLLIWQIVAKTYRRWLTHFYLMVLISLIPFFIVNGILTAMPVVIYDNTQNLALRLGTVPVEDIFYFMAMMLMVMMVYKSLSRSKSGRQSLPKRGR